MFPKKDQFVADTNTRKIFSSKKELLASKPPSPSSNQVWATPLEWELQKITRNGSAVIP
jgi:hypothetical protein